MQTTGAVYFRPTYRPPSDVTPGGTGRWIAADEAQQAPVLLYDWSGIGPVGSGRGNPADTADGNGY